MTVHVSRARYVGTLPRVDAVSDLTTLQMAGPFEDGTYEALDETGSNVKSATTAFPCAWRINVPAGNAAGVFYWTVRASTGGAVSSTSANWLDPGNTEYVFTPDGYYISVDETAPA